MLGDSSQGSADATALILQGRPLSLRMACVEHWGRTKTLQSSLASSATPVSLWWQCVFGCNPLLPGIVLMSPTKRTPRFSACRCLHSPVTLKSQKWWGGQMPATEASLRHHTGEHHRNKHYKEFPWWGGEGTQSKEASWGPAGRCGWWAEGAGWAGPFLTCQVTSRHRHRALGASWDLTG